MSEMWKYLLWQVPGWLVAGAVVTWVVLGLGLTPWLWVTVPLVVLKDLLLLPAMRRASGPPKTGRAALIGALGEAVERVAPSGYVRVRGELWEATTREPGAEIPKGGRVVVREVRGLTLVVDEADDQAIAGGRTARAPLGSGSGATGVVEAGPGERRRPPRPRRPTEPPILRCERRCDQ